MVQWFWRFHKCDTNPHGEVLESWNVTIDPAADISDEYNLTKSMARNALLEEMASEMTRHDAASALASRCSLDSAMRKAGQ